MDGFRADAVLARIERQKLSDALTAVHRNGFGHLVRVLDPHRDEIAAQVGRIGYDAPPGFVRDELDCVAIMIAAAARSRAATDLLERHCVAGSVSFLAGRTTRVNQRLPVPVALDSNSN